MKKDDTSRPESKESELNSAELQMLTSSLADSEDRSKLPPPEKKKQSKLVGFAKKNTALTVIISVATVLFVAVAVFLCVYFAMGSSNGKNKRDYVFTYGEEKVKVKYERAVINDVLYLDMSELAKYADLSVSGSENTKKYVVSDEQYIKFTNESEYAVINSAKVVIPAPAIVKDGKCLVPYAVISKVFETGLEFKSDMAKHKITVTRVTYSVDDILYNEDITFTYEDFTVAAAIVSTQGMIFEYNSDISGYLTYIAPENDEPYLMLVNKTNPLGPDFIPDELANISELLPDYTGSGETYFLNDTASKALSAMISAMYRDIPKNGAYVTSAYRSYNYQVNLFEGYVSDYMKDGLSREAAEAEVLKTSARPGTSEHQSGLCVDFITTGMKNGLNNAEFETKAAFRWLSQNAYKYGFILRYPESKTAETGYDYESWHYRFVGRDVAATIYASGICLEEYLEIMI